MTTQIQTDIEKCLVDAKHFVVIWNRVLTCLNCNQSIRLLQLVVTFNGKAYSLRTSPSLRCWRSVRRPHYGHSAEEWAIAIVDAVADEVERKGFERALRAKYSITPTCILASCAPELKSLKVGKVVYKRQVILN